MALKPAFSQLETALVIEKNVSIISFLGGNIRSIEGLDERSAFGLHDARGVVIVSAGINTLLTKSGLRNNDVIVAASNTPIKDVDALVKFCQNAKQNTIQVTIYRNQQPFKKSLQLK